MNLKKILSAVISAAMIFGTFAVPAMADEIDNWIDVADTEWYGDGTATSYEVDTPAELAGLAKLVNEGNDFSGKTVNLTASINLEQIEWTPIGYSKKISEEVTETKTFKGIFDGGNNTVSNLKITGDKTYVAGGTNDNYKGLFGYMQGGKTSAIKNLTIDNAAVSGCLYVGTVLGRSYTGGIIENCHVTGDICVDGYSYIGGLVGRHDYSAGANVNGDVMAIYNCSVADSTSESGTISGDYEVTYVGGIVGFVGEGNYVIDKCTVRNVKITGTYGVGGVSGIGHYGNTISNSEVDNLVVESINNDPTSKRTDNVGLIAGVTQGNDNSPTKYEGNVVTETTGSITYTDETTKIITNIYGNKMDGEAPVTNYVAEIGGTPYETLEAAFAAAAENDTITMLADATPVLTSQRAITNAATIDLGGKTLTLTEDDLYFGTTTFKNGKIVVAPSVVASTAVFWMFANQTLTFNGVEIVATGVTGTYLIGINGGTGTAINLVNNSKITIENDTQASLTAVICDNGEGNSVTIEDSELNIKNIEGRAYLGGKNGSITVEDSDVTLDGVKEGFYLRAGQTLAVEGESDVDITLNSNDGRYGINVADATATYTKADTATVDATVYNVQITVNAYVSQDTHVNGWTTVWGQLNINGTDSFYIEIYSGETYLGKTTLVDTDKVLLCGADKDVTWHAFLDGSDSWWNTEWEVGPVSNLAPTDVKYYVDGEQIGTGVVKMSAADDLNPVVWEDLRGVRTSDLVFDTNSNDDITVSEGHYKSENRETEGIKWCTYTFIVSGEFNSVAVETIKDEKSLTQTKNQLANISGQAMFGVVATGVGSLDAINVTATNN